MLAQVALSHGEFDYVMGLSEPARQSTDHIPSQMIVAFYETIAVAERHNCSAREDLKFKSLAIGDHEIAGGRVDNFADAGSVQPRTKS